MIKNDSLVDKKVSKSAIARILGVHRLTVAQFVKESPHPLQQAQIRILQIWLCLRCIFKGLLIGKIAHLNRIAILNMVYDHCFVKRSVELVLVDAEIPYFSGGKLHHVCRVTEIFHFASVDYYNLIA